MKKHIFPCFVIIVISTLLCTFATCYFLQGIPIQSDAGYISTIATLIGVMVTFAIGYQILSTIKVEENIKENREEIDSLKRTYELKIQEIDKLNNEIEITKLRFEIEVYTKRIEESMVYWNTKVYTDKLSVHSIIYDNIEIMLNLIRYEELKGNSSGYIKMPTNLQNIHTAINDVVKLYIKELEIINDRLIQAGIADDRTLKQEGQLYLTGIQWIYEAIFKFNETLSLSNLKEVVLFNAYCSELKDYVRFFEGQKELSLLRNLVDRQPNIYIYLDN